MIQVKMFLTHLFVTARPRAKTHCHDHFGLGVGKHLISRATGAAGSGPRYATESKLVYS
jgi:hypothetical protein